MNNLKKRCLTLLLSLAMIVTYMPTSMIAYAVDANGQAEIEQQVDAEAPATEAPAEETVTEEAAPEEAVSEEAAAPEEAPVEEAAPEEAATEEEAAPEETAPAEEAAAEEVATEEPASVEEETPAETEEPVVVETEEEDAEEAEEPEEKFAGGNLRASDSLKRYEAVVSYGEEAKIPDGAKLVLTPLKEGGKKFEEAKEALVADENGNSAFSQATEEEQKDLGMVAFDLTIYDKEGKKVEPQAEVNVSFKLNELPDGVDAEALAASMEIQHLNESSGDIVVEKIATVDGYEAKKDDALGEINVNENNETAEVKTVVDGFSTYTITWSNGTERTTVHYGYMENGTFHEFDADPAPMPGTFQNHHRYLIYDFNDYQYADHTYYRTTASNTPASGGTEIQARLRYYGNDWQRTSNGSNWSDCANNSHIYVLYEKKTAATTGGTAQAHITPETEHPTEPTILKESADNHDGTRTLALSITGHTTPLEAEKLADVIVVFDRSGSMRYNMAGTGNQYGTANTRADQINENARLSIAARAVNSMARTLLSKTNSSGGKLIRMALIDFSTSANVTQGFTDNINTFTSAVNALTGNGGTNWEQSLQLANQLPVDSERATFVIFVSDGDPTFRVSRMDVNDTNLDIYDKDSSDQYYVSDNVFGNGSTDPAGHDYDAALVEAKSIVQHNKRLYTIGISNDVSNMAKLNSEAGGSGNYTATTSAQLEEAFNQIISEIEGTLGYGANIEDGVTGLTNLTAKAPIVGVDENSFKYYRNGQEWDPVAAGAKAAKYNAETGAVEWDLGTNFQLENDVTYKVEFLVWPSQKAIDYVTQLNNGEIQYSEIPEADRNQIEERPAGSGKYVLKTNTDDAHVTYQESSKVGNVVTPIGETKTAYFKPVDPLQLDTMPLSLEKIWTDTLTEGEDRETEVTLFLQRRVVNGDGTFGPWVDFEAPYTKPDGSTAHSNKIVLSDGNDWKATFYISPGLETDHDGTTVVYNPGYEFRVTEPNQDYHYELNGEIIKPMLINLEKTYVGDADGNHALTAENIVKSGIDVKKTLFDKNGNKITPDVEFTIKGKILDPKGNPYTFNMAWDDRDDKSTAAGASAEWVEHQNDPIAFHKYDKDGTRIGYKLHVASTDNIEITLKPGEYVRFVNVPQNCTFEFEENDKDGFELEDIDASIKKMKDGTLVPDTDAAPINTENDKATLVAPGLIGDRQYSVGFNNKVTETTKATVTKKFTGITADQLTDAFKNGYSITANYNGEDHTLKLTDTGVEVSSDGLTFTWTIKDLIIGDKVTVTESGHDTTGAIPGYEFQADGSTVEDTIDSLAALDAGGSIPESNKAELVNDYLQMVTDKSVKKIWGNPDDLEKLGITKVVVTLYRIVGDATNKVEVESFDLTAKNGWEHTFTNLPLYIDGVPVAYQILETAVYGTIDGQEKDIKHLFDVDTVVDGDTTTITNTYDVTPVEVSFPVKKVMSVPEGATGPNWSYGITVEAQGGAPAATTMTGTVTKAAPVTTFGPFKYDVPGTYTYKVTETGTYPNVTNDSEATSGKTVTVTVTDNGDGTLTATADSTAESPVTFTNVYEPDSTSKALEAKKTLNGRTLKADEFSFELYEKGGTTPIQTKKNAADGSVAFDAITYTKAGTYEYTIKEVVPTGDDALGGVTYDTTEHTAVVTVVDNGNGTMTATVKYDGEDAVPEFVNTYEADGNVTFAGTKTIDGRDMTSDDIFEFEVSENGTTNKWTVNNSTVDGSIAYPTISYTLDDIGTHTYTVKETSTDGDGITVDTNTYTVTVKVSDNGDGTLKVEASDNAKELDFVNTYKATGSVTFEGTKSIDSRDFNENEVFNFSITEGEGESAKTWTATSDTTGKITYPKIDYTLADVGTHTYTVKETSTNGAGITVDTNTYTVTVKVSDNGDGTLKVEASDNAKKLDFVNTYEADGEITFAGTKTLNGRDLTADDKFTFEVSEDGTTNKWTATNDETGKISYPTISYHHDANSSDLGDHTYTVKETSTNGNGITVDTRTYKVTINVADGGYGELVLTPTGDDKDKLDFVNEYAAKGEVTFKGTKTLEGRALTEDDVFTFQIKEGDTVVGTATNDANGNIVFPKIEYSHDSKESDIGTHTYTVSETSTDGDGITVDTNTYTVTVKVSDNGNGTLKVEPSNNYESLDFVNTYKATGSVTFEGTKALRGRELTDEDVFTFEITEGGKTVGTATSDTTGKITYPKIDYTLADVGTHTYTVKETSTDGDGITVDTNTYTVTVKVSDNGNGTLKVEPSKNYESLDFINTYEAKGEITFAGTKTIEGRDMTAEDVFTFEITEGEGESAKTWTATSDGSGKITYPKITYHHDSEKTDIGTHTYTVKETSKNGDGITVDTNTYEVKVNVSDNGDGTLKVEPSDNAKALNFVNTYEATGSTTFEGTKTIDGRAMTSADVFEFEVSENGTTNKWTVNNSTEDGSIAYPKITYHHDSEKSDIGTHTYTVKETSTDGDGITVDTNTYTVTVKVSDNGDGTLKVEASDNAKELDFVNTYKATGSVTFEGTKSIDSRDFNENEVFNFSITEGEGESAKTWTATSDTTGKITYPKIDYTLADVGTHTYTVKETSTDGDGITVDTKTYEVTVKVSDNGDGTLKVEASDNAKKLDFVNTYEADGEITFAGTKTLNGRDLTADDKFTFEVSEDGTTNKWTATNDETGKISYPTISYHHDANSSDLGDHTYTVKETSTNGNGITVDTRTYKVTINVADGGYGELVLTPTGDDKDKLDFVNEYAAKGEITFKGTKTLEGRALTEDDVFTFQIKEGDTVVGTATNDANGNIVFPKIEYSHDSKESDIGTHTYTVSETSTDGDGITVDTNTYTVTVKVSDNGNGTLKVEPSKNYESLDFINTYEAKGEITFEGTKALKGRELTDEDVFTFEITEGGKTVGTATSDATGKITYPTINYKINADDPTGDLGEHIYTVIETSKDGKGITVDTKTYTVKVKVSDNGDGTLKIEPSDNAKKVDFVNTYRAIGDVTFAGKKTIEGRKMTDKDIFTFEITEGEGESAKTWTATSDGSGKITYPTIGYEINADDPTGDLGEHTYTVKETSIDGNGITVDTNTYEVKVNVSDNGDGTLKVEPSDNAKALNFVNTYEAKGDLNINGLKNLRNGNLKDKKFEVELVQVDERLFLPDKEKVIEKVTVPAKDEDVTVDGDDSSAKFSFETITFTKNKDGNEEGTYTYIIREIVPEGAVNGEKDGVRYDTHEEKIIVTVTDNGDGTLKVVKDPNKTYDIELLNSIPTVPVKDVHNETKKVQKVDGKPVAAGDELKYEITYKNTTGKAADVTISDTIPEHTAYVPGSAKVESGPAADSIDDKNGIVWTFKDFADGAEVKVSFKVKVDEDVSGETIVNDAEVDDGTNKYTTNEVSNPTPPTKDVFKPADPKTSINGKEVKPGDELTYSITFKNTKAEEVDVTITDVIPKYTTYVDGSADKGGKYDTAKKMLTWEVKAPAAKGGKAGEVTVSFKVTVDADSYGQTLKNEAVFREGADGPEMKTNPVENPVTRILVITKDLKNFVQHGEDVNATFAFRITGDSASRGAYNNVVAMEFSGSDSKELTVKGLPSDIKNLKVEEIVSGNYTPSTDGVKLDAADGKYKVTFTNKYDDTNYKSGTINNYKRTEKGKYIADGQGDKKSQTPGKTAANAEGSPGDQGVNN